MRTYCDHEKCLPLPTDGATLCEFHGGPDTWLHIAAELMDVSDQLPKFRGTVPKALRPLVDEQTALMGDLAIDFKVPYETIAGYAKCTQQAVFARLGARTHS